MAETALAVHNGALSDSLMQIPAEMPLSLHR